MGAGKIRNKTSPALLVLFSSLLLVGCFKKIYHETHAKSSYPREQRAELYAPQSTIRISAVNEELVPQESGFESMRYLLAPFHQRIDYILKQTTSATTYYDPMSDTNKVIIPAKTFGASGQIWLTPEPGASYELLVSGSPPHWKVRIEESSGAIASGTKNLGFWKHHTLTRKCDEIFCSDWLIEQETKNRVSHCKLIDRNTSKVMRSCKGEECQMMGMCN